MYLVPGDGHLRLHFLTEQLIGRLALKTWRCLPLKVMRVGEQRADESTPRRSTTLRTAYISCFGGKRGDLGQARQRYLPKPRAEAIEPTLDAAGNADRYQLHCYIKLIHWRWSAYPDLVSLRSYGGV